jgi:hypothetical protein
MKPKSTQTKSAQTQTKIAGLTSEIDAIHSASSVYWSSGQNATLKARAEHQRRRDRLDELRGALEALQRSKGKGEVSGAHPFTMRGKDSSRNSPEPNVLNKHFVTLLQAGKVPKKSQGKSHKSY